MRTLSWTHARMLFKWFLFQIYFLLFVKTPLYLGGNREYVGKNLFQFDFNSYSIQNSWKRAGHIIIQFLSFSFL